MTAHRMKVVVGPNGKLVLEGPPFLAGEQIELIMLAEPTQQKQDDRYPLRGKGPYSFDDPFAPAVPPEDWEPNA